MMRSTIVTSLGLFALQVLAAPAEKRQAKKASLAELLLGERIDALIDRTGGKKEYNQKYYTIEANFAQKKSSRC